VGRNEILKDIPAGIDRMPPLYSFSAENLLDRTTISRLLTHSCP
jgi:hypothetical protein